MQKKKRRRLLFGFKDLHDMNFNIPTELLPPYEMEWIRIRISHFRANLNIMHLAHFGGLDCAGDFGRLRIIQKMLFPLFASFQPMALNPSFDITF